MDSSRNRVPYVDDSGAHRRRSKLNAKRFDNRMAALENHKDP